LVEAGEKPTPKTPETRKKMKLKKNGTPPLPPAAKPLPLAPA
jgi:hypothetical protein